MDVCYNFASLPVSSPATEPASCDLLATPGREKSHGLQETDGTHKEESTYIPFLARAHRYSHRHLQATLSTILRPSFYRLLLLSFPLPHIIYVFIFPSLVPCLPLRLTFCPPFFSCGFLSFFIHFLRCLIPSPILFLSLACFFLSSTICIFSPLFLVDLMLRTTIRSRASFQQPLS